MAEYRIVVVVDPTRAKSGSGQVTRELNKVGNAADRTRELIRRAFLFAGVTSAVHQLVQLTDTFTNMQNRLGTVTKGTEELRAVTEELFKVANRTRSGFKATSEMYARTALSTRELGVSQRELIQFTESLNQAIILSGASAREANAGLIQLSQGIASNTLRGDELRSVLEQLPVVADVIAKSVGVSRGELRLMGEAGKISGEIILKAFKESREELGVKFAKTIPTIGQAFEILKNNFISLVGTFNTSSGFATALSQSLITLAENLEMVTRVAVAAGIALGVDFAVRGVGTALRAIGSLTLALATNPIGFFARAAVLATSALIAFSDQITLGSGRLANLQDTGKAVFEALGDYLRSFIEYMRDNFGFISTAFRLVFGEIEISMIGLMKGAARIVDITVGVFKGGADAIEIAFENIPAALEMIFVKTFNAISQSYADFLNGIIYGVNKLREQVGLEAIGGLTAFKLEASAEATDIGKRMDIALAKGILSEGAATAALENILIRAEEIATERIKKQQERDKAAEEARKALELVKNRAITRPDATFEKILKSLKLEGMLLKENVREREILKGILKVEKALKRDLTSQENSLIEAQLRGNQLLKDRAKLLDDIKGPQMEYNAQINALTKLLNEGSITAEEFSNKQRKMLLDLLDKARDVESGIKRGMIRIGEEFGNIADLAEETLVGAFQSAEDALVEFVATGKTDFKSLIDSIMMDLTRLAVRDAITAPLARAMGIAGTNARTNTGSGMGALMSGFSGMFSGGGGGGGAPAWGGGGGGGGFMSGMGSWASLAMSLFGMDNGGDINIGGTGGVDNNVLSINNQPVASVSRGETISVNSNKGGNRRPNQIIMNISTPDADSFRRSEDQIIDRGAMRLRRASRRNNRG